MEALMRVAGRGGQWALPAVVVGTLALMLLPLPPPVVDGLIALNITTGLLVLLTSVHVRRALDFSAFPALLLMTTLFRLGLNVSTTRLILLHGATGAEAAGRIVRTFGEFIVGGSYLVGIVVFLILTLINFVVITKGAGRIAEVSARFTLDALPGKQMSIDSDLAAGLIGQEEARKRRMELAQEADFYGAMDGASKFVRGDAIAGLVITAVNIVGGLIVGVAQNGMSLADAAQTYTILTIGDALVSQIPALLISTAAGMVITRVADAQDLGAQVGRQMFGHSRPLMGAAAIVALIGFVPGMPLWPFALLAGALTAASRVRLRAERAPVPAGDEEAQDGAASDAAGEWEQLVHVEPVSIEVGYGLVPLVDEGSGSGELVRRVTGLRKNLARELGVLLPPVHICDNLRLGRGEYRLLLHGVEVARGEVRPDRLLAMEAGEGADPIDGVPTKEPAFGIDALWIAPGDRTRAEIAGYTVVEPVTVIVTHLSEALRREAHQLLGREELQQLLDAVARTRPRVVEDLVPNVLTAAEVLAVLRQLLREQVSIRDLAAILETLAEAARHTRALPALVDRVRERLGAAIVQGLVDERGTLHAAILDAATETALRQRLVRSDEDVVLAPDLGLAHALLSSIQAAAAQLQSGGWPPVVLAAPDLRYALWQFASRFVWPLHVLSHRELPPRLAVQTEATVAARGELAAPQPAPGRPSEAAPQPPPAASIPAA